MRPIVYKQDPRVAGALDSLGSIKESSGASKTIYKTSAVGFTELMNFSHPGFSNVKSRDHLRHPYGREWPSYPPLYWRPFPRRTLINLAVAGACKSWAKLN
jgi:hypothetical protein